MKLTPKFFLFFCLLLSQLCCFSQTLEGSIFDKSTQKPLQSATVYLDGTTISTLTDENGYFKINSKGNTKPDLVISYIGYITSRITNPFQYKIIKTYIEEDAIAIEEVFIGKGPFSQKQMLKAFKYNFLGRSEAASSCKILNEDDLYFFFDVETNILTATSRNPLKIINDFLSYEINFDLVDFQVKYSSRTLNTYSIKKSSFAGTTFFKEISNNKKRHERRKQIFLGSATHFMHTIANGTWKEEKFRLFVDKFEVNPNIYFAVSDTLDMKKIKVLKDAMIRVPKKPEKIDKNMIVKADNFIDEKGYFNVLYDDGYQSIVDFVSKEFLVDRNGNYTPFYGIVFGGFIGAQKAGDMLPTDYFQNINKQE